MDTQKPSSDFTALVERRMAILKLNRTGLATASGLSASYVSNVLNGIKVPNPSVVAAIATGLQMSERETTALNRAAAELAGYKVEKP